MYLPTKEVCISVFTKERSLYQCIYQRKKSVSVYLPTKEVYILVYLPKKEVCSGVHVVDFWKSLFAQEVDLIRGHIQRLTSLSVWVSVLPVSCVLGC